LVSQSWLTPISHFDHRKLSRSKISVLLLLLAPINIPHTVFGRRRRCSERQALSPTAAEDVFETSRGAEDDEDEDLPRPVADRFGTVPLELEFAIQVTIHVAQLNPPYVGERRIREESSPRSFPASSNLESQALRSPAKVTASASSMIAEGSETSFGNKVVHIGHNSDIKYSTLTKRSDLGYLINHNSNDAALSNFRITKY